MAGTMKPAVILKQARDCCENGIGVKMVWKFQSYVN